MNSPVGPLHRWRKNWRYRALRRASLADLRHKRIIEPELLLLPELLKANTYALDVGSNVGDYLFALEQWVQTKNIYGFEPIPDLRQMLQQTFPNLPISAVALSDQAGQARLKIPVIGRRVYASRATLETAYREPGERTAQFCDVSTDTLDQVVQTLGLPQVDFIKIDVEGHEAAVLRGAMATLHTHRPLLLVEIEQRHHDFEVQRLFDFLTEHRYDVAYFALETGRFHPVSDFDPAVHQRYENLKTARYINNFWGFPVEQPRFHSLKNRAWL